MNYIAHHEAARRYNPKASPSFLFGSFITDFARMAGNRRDYRNDLSPELAAGIKLHNRTNKPAFDDQPVMIKFEQDLRTSFKSFLTPRAAWQAAAVGKDLLFDGTQFADSNIVLALQKTLGEVVSGSVELPHTDSIWFYKIIDHVNQNGPPRYDQIDVVTRSLYRVLENTRTPLPIDEESNIANVLSVHQPAIFELSKVVMAQTVDTLKELLPTSS